MIKNGIYTAVGKTGSEPNNGVLTIQQNGETVGTFSANQAENETINIAGGESDVFAFSIANDRIDCSFSDLDDAMTNNKVIIVTYQSKKYITNGYKSGSWIFLFGYGTSVFSSPYLDVNFYKFSVYNDGSASGIYYTSHSFVSSDYTPTGTRVLSQADFNSWLANYDLHPYILYFTNDTNKLYYATSAGSAKDLTPDNTIQDVIINATQSPYTCNLTPQQIAENTIKALKNHAYPLDIQFDGNYNYFNAGSYFLSGISHDDTAKEITIFLESFDQIRLIYNYDLDTLFVDLNYAGEFSVYYEQVTITNYIRAYLNYLMGIINPQS